MIGRQIRIVRPCFKETIVTIEKIEKICNGIFSVKGSNNTTTLVMTMTLKEIEEHLI